MPTIQGPITFKAREELPQAFKDKVDPSQVGIRVDKKATAKVEKDKKKETKSKSKKTSKKKSTKKGAKK